MQTLIVTDEIKDKLNAKAQELLIGYDMRGIDTWDAVMVNDKDGYDINVYQDNENEPLLAIVYEVKNLEANYENWLHLEGL